MLRPFSANAHPGGMRSCRSLPLLAVFISCLCFAGLVDAASDAPPADAGNECLECHRDPSLVREVGGRRESLSVDPAAFEKSAHHALACTECHAGFNGDAIPHKRTITPVQCGTCHEAAVKKHVFHLGADGAVLPAAAAISCVTCHGAHGAVAPAGDMGSFQRARQEASCGKCHERERAAFAASAHGRSLREGSADAPACLSCHRSAVASRGAEPSAALKLAQADLCESCHVKKASVAAKGVHAPRFVASFEDSVHGAALHGGDAGSATCIDCHGAHEMNRGVVSGASVSKQNQPGTCAKCHGGIVAEYSESVHAVALRKGNMDSPVCTDCHGEHEIRDKNDPGSPIHARNVAQQVCASCHASVRLTRKYGLSTNAFQTFSDSYHGLAARGGSVSVVNCASCHSAHAIRSPLDPASSVNKDNLVRTCGQCHPGANARFAVGSVHVSAEAPDGVGDSAILRLIADLYVWFIVLVVGSMTLHNLADLLRQIRRKIEVHQGTAEMVQPAHRLYLRMTLHERLQHAALMISFVLLVVTGFMLRYPEAWWVAAIRGVSARAFEWRGLVHRLAGVAILAAGAWHAGYLLLTEPGRFLLRDLLPRKRDFVDPFRVLGYNLGLLKTKPEFPRFSYVEKAEYWALVWGTVLMGITGMILWFENTSIGLFTKLGFDISRTIHFYEAILATLAIFVWHFYFVLFNPDVYPMSLAWLTGRVSEKEMAEHHALELKRLKQQSAERPAPPPDKPPEPPTEA